MEKLIEQINRYCNLSKEEETVLRQSVRTLHFPKGTAVVETGKVDDSIYFIRKGVWRAYADRDGEQQTLWFAIEGESVFSSWGYTKGLPSRFTISSSSDSIAIELKKSTVQKLIETSPDLMKWLNELLVDVILSTDDLLMDISVPNAGKRYLAFMKKMPMIFQNVSLKEIAGYLGVTPQSLSRIRASLNKLSDKT